MTELTPEAKRVLAQLRAVDDPTAKERASGDAAVRGMLEAHGLGGLPPLAAGRTAALAQRRAGHAADTTASRSVRIQRASDATAHAARAVPSGAGAKLALGLMGALVAALGLYAALGLRTPAPRLLAPAQLPEANTLDQPPSAAAEAPPAQRETMQHEDQPEAAATGSKAHARRDASKLAVGSLREELKFVASVDAELRSGSYEHALQRLAQHKGSAALAEERAALRVLALCGRDNDAAAAQARDHFLRGAPSSVLAARVRAACRAEARP